MARQLLDVCSADVCVADVQALQHEGAHLDPKLFSRPREIPALLARMPPFSHRACTKGMLLDRRLSIRS
eukprot:CAMPEP_0206231332 /NCGR_PEP_ID=MMETSP0047_2-20121206/10777_1 /ASSEMBLY_ACC=CAM_ASM_000192 /TAXON_ID=195065 /ORGANISM="Chroomonas mesostigmatica_cf, Strain CCMP1168" /LENGTH=68 /DNA_ID=CAMNT_0053654897 /DNA_START=558 /DNA_END=764 /DNA_ORIENTATION=+